MLLPYSSLDALRLYARDLAVSEFVALPAQPLRFCGTWRALEHVTLVTDLAADTTFPIHK